MAHGQAPADSAAADAVADGDAVTAVDARAAAGLLPTDELRTLQDGPIPVAPDGLWLGAGRGEGAPAGQTRERARRAGRSRRSRGERAPARGGRLRFLSRLPPGGVRRKEERPFDRGCVPKPAHVAALFGCARRRVRVTTRTRAGSHLAIAAAVPSPAAVPAATPLSSLSTQTPSSLRIRWQLDGRRWARVGHRGPHSMGLRGGTRWGLARGASMGFPIEPTVFTVSHEQCWTREFVRDPARGGADQQFFPSPCGTILVHPLTTAGPGTGGL